jgi:chromosome segregation ATPase
MMPDFTQLNLPVWAILFLLVLAWLSREGIGAYQNFSKTRNDGELLRRKVLMDEKLAEEQRRATDSLSTAQRELAGWTALVGELRARVSTLEEAIKGQQKHYEENMTLLHAEHTDCLKRQAAAAATIAESQSQIATLKEEVKSLREWRHDIANQAQVAMNEKTIAEVIARKKVIEEAEGEQA